MEHSFWIAICKYIKYTMQERYCRSRALRVTLKRESEIACTCAGGFVYFVINNSVVCFPFTGLVSFYLLHALILNI